MDCGSGNIQSVTKALEHLGAEVELTSDPARLAAAKKIVLPGQGEFGSVSRQIDARNLTDVLVERAREADGGGRPFMGICVGLQILFDRSAESPGATGLAVWPGACARFDVEALRREGHKVPHMGWSPVEPCSAAAGGC